MYEPYTDDELEEKYRGQMDDMSDPQYAYERGMIIYNMCKRCHIDDLDCSGLIIYWLLRYINQEENDPECVKKARYVVTKLFRAYPELREEFAHMKK